MRRMCPWWALSLSLIAGLVLAGCGDLPTDPAQNEPGLDQDGPAFAMVEGTPYGVFSWRAPTPLDRSGSSWIGEDGGEIHLSWAGVRLVVPEGAIRADPDDAREFSGGQAGSEEITMTVLRGRGLAISFSPHGLQFDRPAQLIIELDRTEGIDDPAALAGLFGVYFEGAPGRVVKGLEVLPVQLDNGRLILELNHFSGYLLASG